METHGPVPATRRGQPGRAPLPLAAALAGARAQWLFAFALAAGLVLWSSAGFLLGEGVGIYDWQKELHYYHYLAGSLREYGQIPLSFVAVPVRLAGFPVLTQTSSYWGNPEVPVISPLLPLLLWIPPVAFVKASLAFHLVVACAGAFVLAARLGIGASGALSLALLTAGNPWLMQHQAIGYTPWMAAGYLPLIAALLVREVRPRNVAAAAALLALLVYQGALHVFLWSVEVLIVLGACGALRTRQTRPLRLALQTVTGALILALPRLVAIGLAVGGMVRAPAASYSSVAELGGLLVDASSPLYPADILRHTHGTVFYDASFYCGRWLLALGGLLLAVHPFLRRASARSPLVAFDVWATIAVFVALGWQGTWSLVIHWLPWASAQNYPYRFLPLAGFVFIAWVVCEGHTWLCALLGRRGAWLLPLLLLPTLVAFHSRNATLVAAATSRSDVLAGFRLSRFFTEAVTVAGLPATALRTTPRGVTIALDGGGDGPLLLPWIRTHRERDGFEFHGAQPSRVDLGRGLWLSPAPGVRRIEVRARDYGALPLSALAALLWTGWWVALRESG